MNCLYCYVPDSWRKQKKTGDKEILLALREFIGKVEREGYRIGRFCFHGSEPTLMSPEDLARGAALLRAHWHRNGISQKAPAIQTNGLNLNRDYLEKLKKAMPEESLMRIGFSIDPPAEVHDKYRNNSFEIVENNLNQAIEMGFPVSILSVVTADTLDRLDEFSSWTRKYLNLKNAKGNPYKVKIKFATGSHGLDDSHVKEVGKYMIENELLELVQILSPEYCLQSGNECRWYEFDIDGNCYSCNKSFGPDGSFANWRETSFDEITRLRSELFADEIMHEDCSKCPYEAFCSSGCPIDRFKQGPMAGKAHECSLIKMAYDNAGDKGNIFDL